VDITEVKRKAEAMESNVWNIIREFEKETGVHVRDINISRITNIGERSGALYQVHMDIGLW
jgi:hypothetical protein